MIEIQRLSKSYGRRLALADVSLTVRPGEVTLLLGANGAGKSTLLRCILGLSGFDGSIRVNGQNPLTSGPEVRAQIGYMPQAGGLHTHLTVSQTMAFYAAIRRATPDRGARLLHEAGLGGECGTRVGDLSGGMRQRLAFAVALLADPSILVLDEPTASLDAAGRAWLAGRLRHAASEGRVVLVSTHAGQELLAAGHRCVTLEDGRLVDAPDVVPYGTDVSETRCLPPRSAVAGAAAPIARKELTDALGSRWLIGYASLIGLLGLAATSVGLGSTSGLGLDGFGRTTATLMNLCLLLAPLVAVLMGTATVAGEQERGTLEHLLAQPLSRTAVLLAKYAGLMTALAGATLVGFAPAGVAITMAGGPGALGHYLLFPALATLATASMAGIGLVISVTSRSAVQAQGTAIFAWFASALLYDLVLIGSLAVSGAPASWLAASLLLNPIDATRVLGVLALEPDLYLLGPAGAYLTSTLGPGGAAVALLSAVGVWTLLPVVAAVHWFSSPLRRTRRHDSFWNLLPGGLSRARRGRGVQVDRRAAGLGR